MTVTTYKMLVAAHKPAVMPDDELYFPVHVGHALSETSLGYQPDDEGDNISTLNRSYCELTALYWAWKNLDADVVGLSHYRRYFVGNAVGPRGSAVMSSDDAHALMSGADVVLARPRNYYVETIDSHYRNGHHGSDLDVLRSHLSDAHPQYLTSYDAVFQGRKVSLYNMFLMRRDCFDEYAQWLFGVLDAVAPHIDNGSRTAYQQRTFGYLGERLLNVWAHAQSENRRVTTHKIVNTDGEPKVQKAVGMLKRKFGGAS
ncbi:DUF4422 domain-containing protein [Microbacterium shaanxiense]